MTENIFENSLNFEKWNKFSSVRIGSKINYLLTIWRRLMKRRNFEYVLPSVLRKFASPSRRLRLGLEVIFPANLWKEKILCSTKSKNCYYYLLAMLTFDFSLCQVSSVMWTCDRCNYLLALLSFSRLFSLHLWKRIFPQCYKNPKHALILGKPIYF